MPDNFDQIAGYTREKTGLREVCGLMKNMNKLTNMGIRLPSGILLIGEPGVGKTAMAEALIAESGFGCVRIDPDSYCGGDGSLSSYLTDVAQQAKDIAPCILFADELDKLLGMSDGSGFGCDMETTRAFLRMMDSLKNSQVTVLAIANEADMLIPAVRRSGRFDRVIHIGLPECRDRLAILRHYAVGKTMAFGIDYALLAQESTGMSGADLECVMNEAGLYAVSQHRKRIRQSDIEYALEFKRYQGVSHENELSPENMRVVATHEVGHAMVALRLCPEELVNITVLSYEESSGHVTIAHKASALPTKLQCEARLAVLMGGRAAEKQFYPDEDFFGAGEDLMHASRIAENVLTSEGVWGLEYLIPAQNGPFGGATLSEAKLSAQESKVHDILEDAMRRAEEIVSADRELMEQLVDRLLAEKTLSREQILEMVGRYDSERELEQTAVGCDRPLKKVS